MTDVKELKQLLFGLIRRSRCDMEKRFARAHVAITPVQFGVLHKIRHQPQTLHDLAMKFGIRPPSLIPSIDALDRKHFVRRVKDGRDRRKNLLTITAPGSRLLNKIFASQPDDALNKAFNGLTVHKRRQLLTLLSELSDKFPECHE